MARKKPEAKKRATERPKLIRTGALWLKKGKNGSFMSGRIEIDEDTELKIIVFKNSYKEEDKHPDYVVYEIPDEEEAKTGTATDDDIPF